MNDSKKSSMELKRQIWEPAGVISQPQDSSPSALNYGEKPKESKKGGQITMEVDEVFHNRGVMENLQNSQE